MFIIKPIVIKSSNINIHKKFYINSSKKYVMSDIKAEFKLLSKFECNTDLLAIALNNNYNYKHSYNIYSKVCSDLHINGDNCINYLVNLDDYNSTHATIIDDKESNKLKYKNIHKGKILDILLNNKIDYSYNIEVKPGEILIFDSNNYHSFDCSRINIRQPFNKGTNLLVHKFRNTIKKNTTYNSIYLDSGSEI
jgi:hypothetical protein